jgi:thioredoxin 1
MSEHIFEITDDNFDQEVLKSQTPVLVDFWATWCGPCKALAPTVEQLSTHYSGKIKFCKVDVDHNPNQAARFGVRSIPTLILFKNGQSIGQLVGNVPKPTIEELFKKMC